MVHFVLNLLHIFHRSFPELVASNFVSKRKFRWQTRSEERILRFVRIGGISLTQDWNKISLKRYEDWEIRIKRLEGWMLIDEKSFGWDYQEREWKRRRTCDSKDRKLEQLTLEFPSDSSAFSNYRLRNSAAQRSDSRGITWISRCRYKATSLRRIYAPRPFHFQALFWPIATARRDKINVITRPVVIYIFGIVWFDSCYFSVSSTISYAHVHRMTGTNLRTLN